MQVLDDTQRPWFWMQLIAFNGPSKRDNNPGQNKSSIKIDKVQREREIFLS